MVKYLLTFTLVACMASAAMATTKYTDGGVDRDWNNAANWDDGVPHDGAGTKVTDGGPGPIIGNGVTARSHWGAIDNGTLTLEGNGTLHTVAEWNIGEVAAGTINMSGDSRWTNDSHLRLGMSFDGTLNLSGNAVYEAGPGAAIGVSAWADSENTGRGYVSIADNAKFRAMGWQFAIKGNHSNPLFNTPKSEVNITGNGRLVVPGDHTAKMNGYIADGLLTGDGLTAVYDATGQLGEGDNVTIVSAIPEPTTLALISLAFVGFGFIRRR
jgi:hypothetical protein